MVDAMNNDLDELRRLVMRAGNTWTDTGLPRVAMVRAEACADQVYPPMLHLVLQGSKTLSMGDQVATCGPASYFVVPVEVPATGQVHPSAPDLPYLAISLTLDPVVIATVLADEIKPGEGRGTLHFSPVQAPAELLDAWLRMLRLMGHPEAIAALAPAYEREILYRVLQGPHGWMLREIAAPDTAMARVSLAIQWIRRDFAEPIRVEALASRAAMSVSAFHRHFKAVTNLSPLQYQKRVRLMQARSLMLANASSVTTAAFEVGYESPTQFSRDYARVFGLPPARDAARILAQTKGLAG